MLEDTFLAPTQMHTRTYMCKCMYTHTFLKSNVRECSYGNGIFHLITAGIIALQRLFEDFILNDLTYLVAKRHC